MFRRVLTPMCFAVLAGAAEALAQAPPALLPSTAVSRTVFLSLEAVQAQVDATLRHAATSQVLIAAALAQAPPALAISTPVLRR
jgi:hypothetical protein